MIVTYTPAARDYVGPAKPGEFRPEAGVPLAFTFKPNRLVSAEMEAIEDLTDWTYVEFGEKFLAGSMKAYRAALWVLLKREHPTLKARDLSFTAEEVSVAYDAEETASLREVLVADPDIDDDQREAILAVLGSEDNEAEAPKEDPTSLTDLPSDGEPMAPSDAPTSST